MKWKWRNTIRNDIQYIPASNNSNNNDEEIISILKTDMWRNLSSTIMKANVNDEAYQYDLQSMKE